MEGMFQGKKNPRIVGWFGLVSPDCGEREFGWERGLRFPRGGISLAKDDFNDDDDD